jgi:phospholipid/cholesterol/gamma-HCH transport system ATP-binding protein
MPPAPVIELHAVSLSFNGTPVLSDVSFAAGEGETLFILGAAGSGKSVLLKLILSLLKPDTGEIRIAGRDTVPLPESELHSLRQRMGIVFQEGALFDSLPVYENVAYRLREQGLGDEGEIESRVREVLGFVEMAEAIDKMPAELSGGMRRRVAIARAIISSPSIMLYDSPTAGLDPVTAHTINLLIAKMRDVQKVTSLVVTHRLQDASVLSESTFSPESQSLIKVAEGDRSRALCTQFLVLRDHRVYYLGPAQNLKKSQDPYLRRFLS